MFPGEEAAEDDSMLKGIPGFRDAASSIARAMPSSRLHMAVAYSDRCRMIAGEIAVRCARIEQAPASAEGADARAWLEARLSEAASTPSAVGGAMLLGATPPTQPDELLALRTAAWLRLDRPAGRLWVGGPESQGVWSLLVSITPTDEPGSTFPGVEMSSMRSLL